MKLAAIYNVWDGVELLPGSINCIREHVDVIIIVWQDVSNFGEKYNPLDELKPSDLDGCQLVQYRPVKGQANEKAKRNIGIKRALEYGCTHFLHLDCDEYYEDFGAAKKEYIDSNAEGSVCRLYTYFQQPIFRLDPIENYYVPFIHKLNGNTVAGERNYPFLVDPTRRINTKNVVLLSHYMHHFSWVRKDIVRKANNSTARENILKSKWLEDYNKDISEGFYVRSYDRKIIQVHDQFNLSTIFQ